MSALPHVPAACLWCDAELAHGGPQDCPGCGRALRPTSLELTLGQFAEVLRTRDLVAVLAPTPRGLRVTLVDPAGGVLALSVPSGEGRDVHPVDRLVRRLRVRVVGEVA